MEITKEQLESIKKAPFSLRTLSKSGGSRYLSVGTLLPEGLDKVKVYALVIDGGTCLLLLEKIT